LQESRTRDKSAAWVYLLPLRRFMATGWNGWA